MPQCDGRVSKLDCAKPARMTRTMRVSRPRPVQRMKELSRFVALHCTASESLQERNKTLPRCEGGARVVLSLTTIPDRIARLGPTLNSLLDQTRRADAIYLNIPRYARREQCQYEIPESLQRLSCVERVACDQDHGPATKLIPTLARETDPESCIIVVDDDQIYPRNMLETLLSHSQKLPDAALCSRGFRIPANFHAESRDTLYGTHIQHLQRVEIMQGSAGFLVKPRFFTRDVFDYSDAPDQAFYCDDVWFAGHLARNRVERYVVPFDNCYSRIDSWTTRGTRSLYRNENRTGENDAILFRHFADCWRDIDGGRG